MNARYEFDLRILKERIAHLRSLMPKEIKLIYAIKANPFLVNETIPYVDRFEICSPGESYICDAAGVPCNMTVISGIYKTPAFIESLVANTKGRIYTVESMAQFRLLKDLSEKYQNPLTLLLRITNDSQFGINKEELEMIVAQRSAFPYLSIKGIQFFSGTQKTSLKKLKREISMLDDLLLSLQEQFGYTAQELEYGPGFPVAYFGEELNEEELITGFCQLLAEMKFKTTVSLELGRSIAASCGCYYTPVVDLKCNGGQNYAIVDGGMHHISYFGQFMGMKQPSLYVVGKETADPTGHWNICGSLCSMNDILVKNAPLPDIQIGDYLRFSNTGAYSMTEGISLFLSRDLPEVYIISDNGEKKCVRQSFETYTLNSYH